MIPGEIIPAQLPARLEANVGLTVKDIRVANTGDRPIQVGSHFHFFEVNTALVFDRGAALGFRLNIPSGTRPGLNLGTRAMWSWSRSPVSGRCSA